MRTADGAGVGGGAAMHGQGAVVGRGSRVHERRFLRGWRGRVAKGAGVVSGWGRQCARPKVLAWTKVTPRCRCGVERSRCATVCLSQSEWAKVTMRATKGVGVGGADGYAWPKVQEWARVTQARSCIKCRAKVRGGSADSQTAVVVR